MTANVLGIIKQPVSHEWETPWNFFRALDDEFRFTLDAAASIGNAKTEAYLAEPNGLTADWWDRTWCNPPYGTQIGKWVRKGYEEARLGRLVVMLIPSRTETAYWHDYCMRAAEIRFVRGRLRFSGFAVNAPFPSAVIVFRPGWCGLPKVSAIGRDGRHLNT